MTGRHARDTDRFYTLLERLAARIGGVRRLRDCSARDFPTHGAM